MAIEDRATPNVEVKVVTAEKSTTSDSTGLVKTVQGTVVSRSGGKPGRRWKWTPRKKEAFRLIMQGSNITEAAEKAKVHRNSLAEWMKAPEWLAEAQKYVSESQVSTKLRRLKTTTIIADQLAAKSMKALQDEDMDTGQAGLVLRSNLEYLRAERDLYGEGADQPHGPGTVLQINVGAPGQPQPVDSDKAATAVLAFKDFMSKYDPELAVAARSPSEAAAVLAEKVLQESGLLDTIREEDRTALRQEAEDLEALRRKR